MNEKKQKCRRRFSRELVMQGVYQWRMIDNTLIMIEDQLKSSKAFINADQAYFTRLFNGVFNHLNEIEKQLQSFLDRPCKKLSPIEFSILLIGKHELTYHHEIPHNIIINEAIELAKNYGKKGGYKYVNGVLDNITKQYRAETLKPVNHRLSYPLSINKASSINKKRTTALTSKSAGNELAFQ